MLDTQPEPELSPTPSKLDDDRKPTIFEKNMLELMGQLLHGQTTQTNAVMGEDYAGEGGEGDEAYWAGQGMEEVGFAIIVRLRGRRGRLGLDEVG